MPNLNHNADVNDTRFADLTKRVTQLGKDSADGKDALPRLAMSVVTAAADGVLDMEPKHPSKGDPTVKLDDAAVIYAAYKTGEGKKQYSDYSANGDKANISKLRQIVKLGASKFDGPATLVRAIELRDVVAAEGGKVLAVYPAMLQVAREQDKLDTPITDDEIKEAVTKKASEAPELVDYVKGVAKKIEKLIAGEAPGALQCQDEQVVAAFEKLTEWLAMVEKRDAMNKFMAEAAAMGFDLNLTRKTDGMTMLLDAPTL